MNDAAPPADNLVRIALQRLPIPDHGEAFWSDLGVALDAEAVSRAAPAAAPRIPEVAPVGGDTSPGLVVELEPVTALVPPAMRRASNAVLVALAAAAVLVVGLAGRSLLESRNDTQSPATDDVAAPSAALEGLVADAKPGASTLTTLSSDTQDLTAEAVLAWVDDLEQGRADAAWSAMGTTSQAHFGSPAAFEQQIGTLAADLGGWSGDRPDSVLVTPVAVGDQGTMAMVTLIATVPTEGGTVHQVRAVPVRIDGDSVTVEPFAAAGPFEVVVPEVDRDGEPTAPLAADEALVIVVPTGADAPVLRLDDQEPIVCGEGPGTELTELEDVSGQRCAYLPRGGFTRGEHTLTMGFVGSRGTAISAQCVLFEAA